MSNDNSSKTPVTDNASVLESNQNLPIQKLKEVFPKLEGAQRQLGIFILENSHRIYYLTISELSQQSGVSETTIVRLCRILDYEGYKDFRLAMASTNFALRSQLVVGSDIPFNLNESDNTLTIAKKVIQSNIDVLMELANLGDVTEIEKAVDVISKCRTLQIYGVGSSAGVALDACQRFMRAGVYSIPVSDSHMQITTALHLNSEDVALGISYSGSTRETTDALESAQSTGATTICMTTFPNSRITKYAHIQLITPVANVPIHRETVASRVAQLVLIDILCVLIIMRRSSHLIEYSNKLEEIFANRRYQG